MRTIRSSRLVRPVALLAGLGLLFSAFLASATALTPHPPARAIQVPAAFTVNLSSAISGWFWMRSTAYTDQATWTVANFDPSVLPSASSLFVVMAPLVTNTASGGAGWETKIRVALTYKAPGHAARVVTHTESLDNPFPFRSTVNSSGVGYQTYDDWKVARTFFNHGPGRLTIEVTRDPGATSYGFRPHVAVNAGALQLWYSRAP